MIRREYFYKHSHWRTMPCNPIGLTVFVQLGMVGLYSKPPWLIDAQQQLADALDVGVQ